jgi:hypothetical protein
VAARDVLLHGPELGRVGRDAVEELVFLVAGAPQPPLCVVRGVRALLRLERAVPHVAVVQLPRAQLARPAGLELLQLAPQLGLPRGFRRRGRVIAAGLAVMLL